MKLHPAQAEIAKDKHRFRVVVCGRRFGKTTLAILEMMAKAFSKDDRRICYIAPTYQQARDIAWAELKKTAAPITSLVNESRLELKLRTQDKGISSVILRGWEAIETLRGQHFDFMVIDEIATMKNWQENWEEVIRPTLTDNRGEALFISTPKGFNHMYTLFGMEANDPDYKSFHYTSYDNPHLPIEELDKAKIELTEDRFAQEYMADFRKTEGLVYKEFDRERHLFKSLKDVPTHVTDTIVGIDWGFTNPTAIVTLLKDYDGNFWVTDEFYKTGKTTQEVIEYAKSIRANAYYPDPAEPDRLEECRRAGMNVREVSKDVVKGIDAVRTLLKNGKLRILQSCTNLIQEFEMYTYREKRPGSNEPEEPVKENDHALDALRYALFMQSGYRPMASVYMPTANTYRKVTRKTDDTNIGGDLYKPHQGGAWENGKVWNQTKLF